MERKTKIKKLLFFGVLLLLVAPMLQQKIKFKKLEADPLQGAIEIAEKPTFSYQKWRKGEYQQGFEAYLNTNFGFRSFFIRLNNQQAYSFYREARANGVIIGKENYLYEKNYLKAYLGTDFIGEKAINEKIRKLRLLQDTLQKLDKQILVVLAPGKASYFPEFLPNYCKGKKRKNTNYKSYLSALKAQNINYVDFNRWFIEMKATTKYPLYGKGGIHWSKYGEFLAADSLIQVIGKMRKQPMTTLVLDKIEVKKENEQGDYDIGEGMNLLFDLDTYPMAYPIYHLKKPSTNQKQPKVLFVADSYYWGMFNAGFSRDIFDNGQFWFYNQSIYPDSYDSPINVSDIDIKVETEKQDLIVLLCTDANLEKFAFGFIDQLYAKYFPEK